MSIIPIAPDEEPEDGLFEWRIEHIRPIVERVDRLYDIDKSRVFLCACAFTNARSSSVSNVLTLLV